MIPSSSQTGAKTRKLQVHQNLAVLSSPKTVLGPIVSCQHILFSVVKFGACWLGSPSEKLRVDLSDTMCSRSGQPR